MAQKNRLLTIERMAEIANTLIGKYDTSVKYWNAILLAVCKEQREETLKEVGEWLEHLPLLTSSTKAMFKEIKYEQIETFNQGRMPE